MIIEVKASSPYKILIEKNNKDDIFKGLSDFVLSVKDYKNIAVITDDTVKNLYAQNLLSKLNFAKKVAVFDFKHGERQKTLKTVNNIYDFLSKNYFDRNSLIIALGGGVTGDIAGFSAASFLRGIDYIQVPTTLLAAVDSSVGGKTGVDLKTGKNLVGAIYQPKGVYIDAAVLDTLDSKQILCGMGEVIKYGAIKNSSLFSDIESGYANADILKIIEKCLSIKKEFVENDERDTGIRQALNFGHTLGHAVEKAFKFKVPHGQCVVIGMILISKWAENKGLMSKGISEELVRISESCGFQTTCPFSHNELVDIALRDKKVRDNFITVVLLEKIGQYKLVKTELSSLYI